MPAERRADGFGDIVHAELRERALEIGHRVARGDPSEVAALGARRVLGVRPRQLLEARAADQALAQPVDPRLRVGLGRRLVDLDQDVARVSLVHDRRLVAVALVHELHDVESARAAQDARDLAGLHRAHDVDENRRQARARAPPEIAAGGRVGRVGERRRHLREILARRHLRERLVGAPLARVHGVGRRLLRHRHVDVGHQILVLAAGLRRDRREVVVDLGVGHGDLAVDLAVAHALDDDLAADVLAVVRVGDALALQHLAEFVGRELVLLGDAQDRALDGRVVDADAGLLRVLQHGALGDQALEHLLVEDVERRRRHVGRLQLLQHDAALLVHVPLRDRLVVDDDEHAVERDDLRRRARRFLRGGRRRPSEADA